jgi:hypothetical protein
MIDSERFKDKAFSIIDSAVECSKRAAAFIRDRGDGAVDRIDVARLEMRLERSYAVLGKKAYERLSIGAQVSPFDEGIALALDGVNRAQASLREKAEKNA